MNNDLQSLPKLRDSISYVYIEHAVIEQEDLLLTQGLFQPGLGGGDSAKKLENFLKDRYRFLTTTRNMLDI